MSCWQSTILLLYHHEKVTFAFPCVRPVGPIYGPIACNVLISEIRDEFLKAVKIMHLENVVLYSGPLLHTEIRSMTFHTT